LIETLPSSSIENSTPASGPSGELPDADLHRLVLIGLLLDTW